MTEHSWQMLAAQGHRGAAVNAARASQGRILDLLVAHHVDGDHAYRDRAVEELRSLISWSTWVDPSHPDLEADICTAEAAVAAVVGLDWLWEELTEADRLRVLRAVRDKAIKPYCRSVKDGAWWYGSCQNWNAVINGGCGLAALALSDDDPAAQKALSQAQAGLEQFFAALGREGGWDEGLAHWGYAMRYLLLLNEALGRLEDDQRLIHQRGMDTTGVFPVYFTPNGHEVGFGPAGDTPLHGALYLLVQHMGVMELAWWLDTYAFSHDVCTDGWSAAGLSLLFRPEEMDTPADPELHKVKVFNEIGWTSMADAWPQPTMFVAAKTGDLSASHSLRDMNAVQVQVDGEKLLVDLADGLEDPFDVPDSMADEHPRAARNNTLIIGQRDHALDAQGSVVDTMDGDCFRWVACDSNDACGPDVRFVRHVVMLVDPEDQKGVATVVVDEVANSAAEGVEIYWHSFADVKLKAAERTATIRGTRAVLHAAFAADRPLRAAAHTNRDGRAVSRTIRLKAKNVDDGLFVSAFSLAEWPAPVVKNTGSGATITVGPATLTFKRRRRHLELDSATLS